MSQNFPLHARSLSQQAVLQEVREEIELNQKDYLSEAGKKKCLFDTALK
ncbi:unnamed protein product [Haemonchus placei]|uniref:UGGT thioredoxin-like domain-containing protein n=1 Tax=Haemonchus placei TaxID=6290 RepID=A0A3P8C9W4_HAEPC|nr:unnamed protein product [Haemonchus placei]